MKSKIIFSLALVLFTSVEQQVCAYEVPDGGSLVELHQKAEKGDVRAQSNLAVTYWYNTQSLPRGSAWNSNAFVKCAFWSDKAAHSGDIVSIYLLGWLQFQKEVKDRDERRGRLFLFYAATRGYSLAQAMYGEALAEGLGGARDPLEAAAFLTLSKSPDSGLTSEDQRRLSNLEDSFTKEQHVELAQCISKIQSIVAEQKALNIPDHLTDQDIFNDAKRLNEKMKKAP